MSGDTLRRTFIVSRSFPTSCLKLISMECIEEVVFGSVADVPFMEEKRKLSVTCVNGVKGCVDVKMIGTLVDARSYINEYFD
eukprot:6424320-Ditylum_brightwellii.AAC.1